MPYSVVIPAYRAAGFIIRPVASLLCQTLPPGDIVIVSDDGIDYRPLLPEHPAIRFVSTSGLGTGAANARTVGVAAARCRIVATLDADDEWTPTALERLVPLAEVHGAAVSAISFREHVSGVELANHDQSMTTGPVAVEMLLAARVHTYAGIVFDRERILARWPAWMQRWEDVYFFVACCDVLGSLMHVAEPLYVYYRREGSICNRSTTASEYRDGGRDLAARQEAGESLGLTRPEVRACFARFLRQREALEAAFLAALAAGECRDYQEFLARNE